MPTYPIAIPVVETTIVDVAYVQQMVPSLAQESTAVVQAMIDGITSWLLADTRYTISSLTAPYPEAVRLAVAKIIQKSYDTLQVNQAMGSFTLEYWSVNTQGKWTNYLTDPEVSTLLFPWIKRTAPKWVNRTHPVRTY